MQQEIREQIKAVPLARELHVAAFGSGLLGAGADSYDAPFCAETNAWRMWWTITDRDLQ